MPTELILFSQAASVMNTTNTSETFKTRVRELIVECHSVLQLLTKRRFDQRIDTYMHDCIPVRSGGHVEGRVLSLKGECQSVLSVVNGDGTTLPVDAYTLLPEHETNYKTEISLDDSSYSWQPMPERAKRSIAVRGVWGWKGTWRRLAITLDADIAADDDTCTVSDATGLEAGMMLRLDLEYAQITSITGTTLTLERADQGSTAAAHPSGTVLYRYVAADAVQRVVKRMVRWYSALDDNPLFSTQQMGDIQIPADLSAMPRDLQDMIKALRKPSRIKAVNPS